MKLKAGDRIQEIFDNGDEYIVKEIVTASFGDYYGAINIKTNCIHYITQNRINFAFKLLSKEKSSHPLTKIFK